MQVSNPPLPRALVGRPVTAQDWNRLIAAVGGFYDTASAIRHDYVQVNVSFRQGPVPDARVVAAPFTTAGQQSGPPLQAISDGGDGTGFRVPAITADSWRLYVEAPGFANWAGGFTIPAQPAPGQVAKVDVELTATHLFVPDIVGLSRLWSTLKLRWSGFEPGVAADPRGANVDLDASGQRHDRDGTVLAQGPAAGTAVAIPPGWKYDKPLAKVHEMVFPFEIGAAPPPSKQGPSWVIAPHTVGVEARGLDDFAKWGFAAGKRTVAPGAAEPLRIVDQSPPIGEMVPFGTPLDVSLDHLDAATATMDAFAGTHVALRGQLAQKLAALVNADPLLRDMLGDRKYLVAPWTFARRSLPEPAIQAMRSVFKTAQAEITSSPGAGLREAWQSMLVADRFG